MKRNGTSPAYVFGVWEGIETGLEFGPSLQRGLVHDLVTDCPDPLLISTFDRAFQAGVEFLSESSSYSNVVR